VNRLLRGFGTLLLYFCAATVIAEIILIATLAGKLQLDRTRLIQILALAYGIDLFGMQAEITAPAPAGPEEHYSLEQLLERRLLKQRDLELRELMLQDGAEKLRLAQQKLQEDQRRYKALKDSFEAALKTLQEDATARGTDDVRRILETIKPKQAKEIIWQMLQDKKTDEVVLLLSAMADSKRAKIIGEFKTPEEQAQVKEVLERIRRGVPAAPLAEDTKKKLAQPRPSGG